MTNYYNPALQTSETISPHYYHNGVPYETTQFDSTWNCTALFEIDESTEYSLGLVPAASNGYVKPWGSASTGIMFYDSNGDYIGKANTVTFTTPADTRYARFNYYISAGIVRLAVLNASCMLVKGDTLPETYTPYVEPEPETLYLASVDVGGTEYLLKDTAAETALEALGGIGAEYKFSGDDLLLAYGYSATHDAVVVMNAGRANGLFDFAALCLKPKGRPLAELETANLTTVWSSGTDMHAPFQFNAVNNADGYKSDSTYPGFVGGNHTLDQLGSDFETASSRYIEYYADGKPVSSGSGRCANFEIRWANDVQAYNTVKEGGGGRACLTEYHDMVFDGVQFNETVTLVPSEDIYMCLWYGFQFTSWGNVYTNIRFLGGANRGVYTSGNVNGGDKMTCGMEAWGTDHKIVLTVDNGFDLGSREKVSSNYTDGAFTSGGKGYFRVITQGTSFVMHADDAYHLRGSYRFCGASGVTSYLYADSKSGYVKPSGGIPKTDLASDVQTSLGKADTALQSAPVTSVNGQTGAVSLSIPSTAADVGAQAAPNVVTQSAPTAITLADNTVYYLSNVSSLTLSYPASGHWECLIVLSTASSGTVTVTLPTSSYIGAAPSFGTSQTWELSIRDGVVVAGKAAS